MTSLLALLLAGALAGQSDTSAPAAAAPAAAPPWEADNPLRPLPEIPLGVDRTFAELPDPPTPERVRLGRWLFYDPRLSASGSISCATCHQPEHAFSEPTPVSTGHKGQKGNRKSPGFVNAAWTLYPHFFWDGRAASLEEQALGPVENPIEMGNTHAAMVQTLSGVAGYAPYFQEAFGSPEVTKERVAKAIADYERTRLSGNSPWDRWQKTGDASLVSAEVRRGHDLFFGKAACNQCHLGTNFTDSRFHNVGVGWNPKTKKFADEGRYKVSGNPDDLGAFKTPSLREVSRRSPFMHDGSMATLSETVDHYNKGGIRNPALSPKMKPLKLTRAERQSLVAFMRALEGEGYMDTAPASFPQ